MQIFVTSVLPALIAAAASIVVAVITGNAQHRRVLAELDKQSELLSYRLGQLEKKVDKHNSVVERTYRLEESARLTDERIRVANRRIEDLERTDRADHS